MPQKRDFRFCHAFFGHLENLDPVTTVDYYSLGSSTGKPIMLQQAAE
jgi:hypothetical protein